MKTITWLFHYPHPEEEGVVAYTVLVVLTPILTVLAFFRVGRAAT